MLSSRRPLFHVLPPVIAYLQFATMDRRPPGAGWIVAFVAIATLALLALAIDNRTSVGSLHTRHGLALSRRSSIVLGVTMIIAATTGIGSAVAMAPYIPESGLIAWRSQSGLGSGLYGSGSFNLFVGLQQSLVDLSDDPMFYARVSSSAPENSELYWKLITLDTFDGQYWLPSEQTFARGGEPRWEVNDWQFQGPTTRVAATVRIAGLSGQYLPTLYTPIGLQSDDDLLAESFRVREDGSVAVDLQVLDGWTYQLDADLPVPDLATLATDGDALSPIFQEAVDAGALELSPAPATPTERPASISSYTRLPEAVSQDVRQLARDVTAGASTPFERALLLESFFRDTDLFTYSTDVNTGHTALDLADWLTDENSRNFRTGYCEQFATAMGVMSRALGIPTRVVLGFTPGSVETQSDGSEFIVVRERNAHAWVELWMDGQGWVRFDPTPRADGVNPSLAGSDVGVDARDFIPAPDGSSASGEPGGAAAVPDLIDEGEVPLPGEGTASGSATTTGWLERLGWLALVAAFIGVVPAFKALRRRRRIIRMSQGEVDAAWAEIVDRLADLGTHIDPAHTPLEIARRESPELIPLARRYSAAAYGGKTEGPCVEDFERAEAALRFRYEGRRWRTSPFRVDSLRSR
jgi:transglutaminase-like putative cysteine protease